MTDKKTCQYEGCTNWTGLLNGLCSFHQKITDPTKLALEALNRAKQHLHDPYAIGRSQQDGATAAINEAISALEAQQPVDADFDSLVIELEKAVVRMEDPGPTTFHIILQYLHRTGRLSATINKGE